MTGRITTQRLLLIAVAAALSCTGLVLAALAGADQQRTVRQGVYGPDTCDDQGQVVDTKITKGPKKQTSKASAKFEFKAFYCSSPDDDVDQSAFAFECKLDKEKTKDCKSPEKYGGLKKGKHIFSVAGDYSTGGGSTGDPTPDKY